MIKSISRQPRLHAPIFDVGQNTPLSQKKMTSKSSQLKFKIAKFEIIAKLKFCKIRPKRCRKIENVQNSVQNRSFHFKFPKFRTRLWSLFRVSVAWYDAKETIAAVPLVEQV